MIIRNIGIAIQSVLVYHKALFYLAVAIVIPHLRILARFLV